MKRILTVMLCLILFLGMLPLSANAAFKKGAGDKKSVSDAWVSVNAISAHTGDTLVYNIFDVIGDGPFQYSFDIYRNGESNPYIYNDYYQFNPQYEFRPTKPGDYQVLAWVYDEYDGTEVSWWGPTTTVTLQTPKITSVESMGGTSLKITWSKSVGATVYALLRSQTKTGKYEALKATSSTSTTNTYLKAGLRYFYKVVAYCNYEGTDYFSELSATSAGVPLAKAVISSVKPLGSGRLQVTWKKVPQASGYRVLRSTSKTGTYKFIKATTSNTFINASLARGKTYYFKVQPYKKIYTLTYKGPLSTYRGGLVK